MRANWFWASSGSALLPQPAKEGYSKLSMALGDTSSERSKYMSCDPKSRRSVVIANQLATAMRT
jgi:hypothetical protein